MVQHRALATLLVVWITASDLHAAEETTCFVNEQKRASTHANTNHFNYNILEQLFAEDLEPSCSFLRVSATNAEALATESSTPLLITGEGIFTRKKWSNAKLKEFIAVIK